MCLEALVRWHRPMFAPVSFCVVEYGTLPVEREVGKSRRDEFGHSGLTSMKSSVESSDRDEEEESADPIVSEEPPAAADGVELLEGCDVATTTARPASPDSQDCLSINATTARSAGGGAEAAGGEQVALSATNPGALWCYI